METLLNIIVAIAIIVTPFIYYTIPIAFLMLLGTILVLLWMYYDATAKPFKRTTHGRITGRITGRIKASYRSYR